jgi:uncharacterized protein
MKREALNSLKDWVISANRKPLILRGPRQVGKSTLVRDFCNDQGFVLNEVNLERYKHLYETIVSSNGEKFLKEVQIICNKGKVNSPNSILFIDEIQAIPEAIQFLRYLYEDYPDLPIVSAGSLLEFALQDETKAFSMPVGRVNYHFLGPCTFNEYLGEKQGVPLLEYISTYEMGTSFSNIVHEKLISKLRDYLIVGGMPEALQSFIDTEDFLLSQKILSGIVLTYRDDFLKYSRKVSLENLQKVIDYLPVGVGRKVKYSEIDSHIRSSNIRSAIKMLDMAGVLSITHSTRSDKPPLSAGANSKIFKLYVLDCGILNALSKSSITDSQIKLLNEDDLAEQFVAQHLKYASPAYLPPELYYWLRDGKANNAEVDFVYHFKNRIIPIEVKSGTTGTLKSLHQYVSKMNIDLAVRFDLNPPSLQDVEVNLTEDTDKRIKFKLLSLPLYMIGELNRILGAIEEKA